jgi:hypothetical protein
MKKLTLATLLLLSSIVYSQERFLPHLEVVFEGKSYPMFQPRCKKYVYFKTHTDEIVIIDKLSNFRFTANPDYYEVLIDGEHYQSITTREIIIDVNRLPKNKKVKIIL